MCDCDKQHIVTSVRMIHLRHSWHAGTLRQPLIGQLYLSSCPDWLKGSDMQHLGTRHCVFIRTWPAVLPCKGVRSAAENFMFLNLLASLLYVLNDFINLIRAMDIRMICSQKVYWKWAPEKLQILYMSSLEQVQVKMWIYAEMTIQNSSLVTTQTIYCYWLLSVMLFQTTNHSGWHLLDIPLEAHYHTPGSCVSWHHDYPILITNRDHGAHLDWKFKPNI